MHGCRPRYAIHDESSGLGVRRPLRFLAHKLQLDDAQVEQVARIISELKTERAQAAVDEQRAIATFADAMCSEPYDASKADAGGTLRAQANERVRRAVLQALGALHAVLDKEQRQQFAYLLRTGVATI